jgi:hypothetical protein
VQELDGRQQDAERDAREQRVPTEPSERQAEQTSQLAVSEADPAGSRQGQGNEEDGKTNMVAPARTSADHRSEVALARTSNAGPTTCAGRTTRLGTRRNTRSVSPTAAPTAPK